VARRSLQLVNLSISDVKYIALSDVEFCFFTGRHFVFFLCLTLATESGGPEAMVTLLLDRPSLQQNKASSAIIGCTSKVFSVVIGIMGLGSND